MIKIAICDDSEIMRAEIRNRILEFSVKKDLDYTLNEYDAGEKIIGSGERFDLIFMDYEFENKGDNGLETSKMIREYDKNSTIVFITSYPYPNLWQVITLHIWTANVLKASKIRQENPYKLKNRLTVMASRFFNIRYRQRVAFIISVTSFLISSSDA